MCDPVWLGYWENSVMRLLTHKNPYTGMTLAEDPIVLGVNFFGEMNSGYDRLMMNIPDQTLQPLLLSARSARL